MQLVQTRETIDRIALGGGEFSFEDLIRKGDYTAVRHSVKLLNLKSVIPSREFVRSLQVEMVPFPALTDTGEIDETLRRLNLVALDPIEFLLWGTLGKRAWPKQSYFAPKRLELVLTDKETGITFKEYAWLSISTAPNGDIHLCAPDYCKAGGNGWSGAAVAKPRIAPV